MRGPSKTPPKYRKHKATGRAIVTIDGKDFYLGGYGTKASRIEYDRLIGEWLANGRILPVRAGSIAVIELVAKYWKYAKGYYVKNGKPTDELPGLKIAMTGCRPGEAVAIRPRDIDRESVTGIWLYYPESHKMEHKERHRVIAVGPKAQEVITKYLFRDEDKHCFIRNCGEPFDATHYAQAIKRACLKAKIVHWAPNQIRHKTATEVRKTHGLEGSQVVAGHAQASVTQIYAERDLDKAIQIMREVG